MSLASTRIAARLLAVAALAALTAGCFQPMYAEHTDGTPGLREKLMGVEVPPVDKPNGSRDARLGVEIRNALAFKLYGNATGMPPTHRLVLRFSTSRSSLSIAPRSRRPCWRAPTRPSTGPSSPAATASRPPAPAPPPSLSRAAATERCDAALERSHLFRRVLPQDVRPVSYSHLTLPTTYSV